MLLVVVPVSAVTGLGGLKVDHPMDLWIYDSG